MKICIRADGGSGIGMGHIIRTLVLAKVLKENNYVFYACRIDKPLSDKYKAGIETIINEGFEVEFIKENSLKNDIIKIQADCLITDSYDVDEEYFNIAKKTFKLSGCLDDEKICNYFNVDFLINQNLYANNLGYKINKDAKVMLGNQFVILREEFRNINSKKIKKKISSVLLTLGGSDNSNYTELILQQMINLDLRVDVVVGPGFIHKESLLKYQNNNIKLHFNADMRDLMMNNDIAISSCGTTLYELAVCGTPTIGIVAAENQILAARTMDKAGLIVFSEIDSILDAILKLTYEVRLNMSNNNKKLIDGKGYRRIVDNILELSKGNLSI